MSAATIVVAMLGGLAAIVVLGFVAVLAYALTATSVRRIAVRDIRRRPSEAALVVAGSMLGAALITGSFIVGDTLDSSIRATARTQLGPIDETLTVPDAGTAARLAERIDALDDERIDGVVSFTVVQGSVASNAAGATRAEPEAQVIELDFAAGRSFGKDPAATGLSGETPSAGEAVIAEDLATTLEVDEGDLVTAYLYGRKVDFEVDRVLPRLGLAGFWRGFESTSPNLFVPSGTLARAAQGRSTNEVFPPTGVVAISNRGGVEEGARLTSPVVAAVDDALPPGLALRVEPVKRDLLEDAETQGDEFSELFLNIGFFAILAGILLLVNIFVMLAEERKSQLGMLRAVGMRRIGLVGMFTLEGAIYGLVAAAFGSLAGIGVGWAIARLAAPIFGGGEEFSLDLTFALEAESLVLGFVIGTAISWLTVFLTSMRISRINIIRAIRDLPEPRVRRSRRILMLAGTAIAAASIAIFVATLGEEDAWAAAILAPPVAAYCLVPLLGTIIGRRSAVIIAAGLSLAWGIFGNSILGGRFFDSGELVSFVFQGVLLTFSAVILLSQTQENLEGWIRRLAASRLALRLGVAYPLARRFRTGLTLSMYALVMFTMTFIAVLSTVFGGQIEAATRDEAGGFDMLVTASAASPPDPRRLAAVDGVERVATLVHGEALYRPDGFAAPEPWTITGMSRSFAEIGPPELGDIAPDYSSDAEVWDALLSDPRNAVVNEFFLQEGGGGPPQAVVPLGDTMEVIDPVTGRSTERRVIGVLDSDQAFSGVYMSRASVDAVLRGRVAPNRFYVVAEESADLGPLSARLQGRFVANGVEADSFRSIVEQSQRFATQFLTIMQGYLALGLVVGIAGLGVVMVRAVRERRREIGVLRSLGFLSRQVRNAFVFESGFQALEGIAIGAVLALVTAEQLVTNGDFGEGIVFQIPWLNVSILCLLAFVASLFATAWPARQASRIPPAVALRIAE